MKMAIQNLKVDHRSTSMTYESFKILARARIARRSGQWTNDKQGSKPINSDQQVPIRRSKSTSVAPRAWGNLPTEVVREVAGHLVDSPESVRSLAAVNRQARKDLVDINLTALAATATGLAQFKSLLGHSAGERQPSAGALHMPAAKAGASWATSIQELDIDQQRGPLVALAGRLKALPPADMEIARDLIERVIPQLPEGHRDAVKEAVRDGVARPSTLQVQALLMQEDQVPGRQSREMWGGQQQNQLQQMTRTTEALERLRNQLRNSKSPWYE
jgi:hypothetical protein